MTFGWQHQPLTLQPQARPVNHAQIWTNLLGFSFHQQIPSLLNKAFFPWAKQGNYNVMNTCVEADVLYGTIDFSIVVFQKLIRNNQVF